MRNQASLIRMTMAASPTIAALALLAFAAGGAIAGPLRQSFDVRVLHRPAPVMIDGRARLVYELHVASYAPAPLVLQQLEVLDAGPGTVIAAFAGEALERRLQGPATAPATLDPGTFGVIYLELALQTGDLPRALRHRVGFGASRGDSEMAIITTGPLALRHEPPVTLSPPLGGGPWVAIYDPAWSRGHRRVIYAVNGRAKIPGRFAVDWMLLDEQGYFSRGDPDRVRDWYGYGSEVLAVADGVIAAARDDVGESETVSGHDDPPLEDATGNYVALDLGQGRFAFYEHLQPGSVRVERGQRVRRGQVIAALGFTGSSTGPHLHFHVADANSPLDAEGLPFVLDRFKVLGVYDEFEDLGSAPWTQLEDATGGQRRAELPAANAVVEFSARQP